jgi:hypothetical protein
MMRMIESAQWVLTWWHAENIHYIAQLLSWSKEGWQEKAGVTLMANIT